MSNDEHNETLINLNTTLFANDFMRKAGTIAADNRFTPDYKAEQLAPLRQTALSELDQVFNNTRESLEADIKTLETQASYVPVVSDKTDIAKLTYTRDVLATQWQKQPLDSLLQHWQAALDNGDTTAVRVYHDFAEGIARAKISSKFQPLSPEAIAYMATLQRLQHTSADYLLPDTVKQARANLAYQQRTLVHLRLGYQAARNRITQARLTADGLVDGGNSFIREMLRNF